MITERKVAIGSSIQSTIIIEATTALLRKGQRGYNKYPI